VGSFAFTLTHS